MDIRFFDDNRDETPGAGNESRKGRMSDMKRKAIIGSVFLFVLGVTLVGVTGFTTPGPSEWEEEGVQLSEAFANEKQGEALFTNARTEEPKEVIEAAPALDITPAPQEVAKKDDSFAPVEKKEWVYKAVKDLAADELPNIEDEFEGQKPVSRYELAVILARVLEKLQGAGKVIEGPLGKVALLEKLSKELRTELEILGVAQARFTTRLGKLEKRMGQYDKKLSGLEKNTKSALTKSKQANAEAKTANATVKKLEQTIASYDEKLVTSEKRLRKLSDIMSRLLVKVALNDSRIKDLKPVDHKSERRELGTIARAINGLQKKVSKMEMASKTSNQRMDTLSRTIERVSTTKRQAPANTQKQMSPTRMRVLTKLVGKLRKRIDETEDEVAKLKKTPQGKARVSPKALAEVKGLLKGFFNSYESRLKRVERKMM